MPAKYIDFNALTRRQIEAAVWFGAESEQGGDVAVSRALTDLGPASDLRRSARDGRTGGRPAAVLCAIAPRPEGWSVILTRRSPNLKKHAGQIAFPGGKIDADDPSPKAAALREAREEIGLLPDQVEVLGAIDPYLTVTGYQITPFVGLVSAAYRPLPDPGEVAEVFEAPLGFLMDPAHHQRRILDKHRAAVAIPYGAYDIWGATAGMLRNLSNRLRRAHEAETALASRRAPAPEDAL